MQTPFLAGYAQQIITPDINKPVYLAGFGHRRIAQSVHDDLYVRVLALQKSSTQVALVALDLIGLARFYCQQIEQRIQAKLADPDIQVIVACSHTHHAPDTIGFWGEQIGVSGVDPAYLETVLTKVVDTALEAFQNQQPAALKSTSVMVQGVAKNARDPDILDEELSCIQCCHAESSAALATLLIYPCHPEVLWNENPHITSDYVHSLRREVETATGAPALFMAGALGGMMTPDMPDQTFESAEQMGQVLAQAAVSILQAASPAPVEIFSIQRQAFPLELKSFLYEQAIQMGLIAYLNDPHADFITETNLIQLGHTWLITVPGELLPKLGLALKAELKAKGAEHAAVIGLANDEIGYILPEDEYIYPENPFEPGEHYEETMSPGPKTAAALLAAIHQLL